MSNFEVVRSDVEGWDVRRVGEAQALSNYATKEQAEEAARLQGEAEAASGDDADAVDIRQDVFSEGPEEDLNPKRTIIGVGTVAIAVILLLVVASLLVALTDFGG